MMASTHSRLAAALAITGGVLLVGPAHAGDVTMSGLPNPIAFGSFFVGGGDRTVTFPFCIGSRTDDGQVGRYRIDLDSGATTDDFGKSLFTLYDPAVSGYLVNTVYPTVTATFAPDGVNFRDLGAASRETFTALTTDCTTNFVTGPTLKISIPAASIDRAFASQNYTATLSGSLTYVDP